MYIKTVILHFVVPGLLLKNCVVCRLFIRINFFEKSIQEYYQSANSFDLD